MKIKKITKSKAIHICAPNPSDIFNQIVLDNVPVSIITINKKGYITSVNKYFKKFPRIKDYTKLNIFKDKFFIRENLVDDYKKLLNVGGIFRKDNCREVGPDGEIKYLRIIAVPYYNDVGEISGVVSLASDNTEAVVLKNRLIEANNILEEKVMQRTEELHSVNRELIKTLELKSVFIADVSHEFRTALTIMQCSLELISKSGELKNDNLDLSKNIITEIKRISGMLSDLSLLAKPHSPVNLKLRQARVELNSMISSICKELKVLADESKISITYKNDSNEPIEIMAVKDDISKLLVNLIRNAIKYNKKNGWINVWVEKAVDGVFIKVEDSGVGIPEAEFENIFERFYRVDKSRTRHGHDSGLGLAICKHIAEEHGGKISVASKVGHGSTFTIYLPNDYRNGNK